MKSRDEWDKIIEDLESSGLSVLEFARERMMCGSRLYYHRKRRTQRRRELITLKAREVRAIDLTPSETELAERSEIPRAPPSDLARDSDQRA